MNKKKYDYIVFGANIPGIIFAIKKSNAGHSVLLTNIVGFPGGNVTELLNCYQEADESQLQGIVREVYHAVSSENFERSVVNPESIKFTLQQLLEKSSVEVCYHVRPKTIEQNGAGMLDVSLLAKEGIITMTAAKVVDASDDYYGAILFNRKRTIQERRINLFISRPSNDDFLSFQQLRMATKLSDGRYWISLTVDTRDELFAENDTHELLDAFRIRLERSNSRIQVLPLGTETIYSLNPMIDRTLSFTTIDEICGISYQPFEQFRKGLSIEMFHNRF